MAHIIWSTRIPAEEMCWRAGGRRRINAIRQFRADLRRVAPEPIVRRKRCAADGRVIVVVGVEGHEWERY